MNPPGASGRVSVRAAAVALAALTLAGCLAPVPAETIAVASVGRGVDDLLHDLGEILEATVPVDGAALHGTVYLPDLAATEKVPVILDLGPYYGNLNPETSAYREDMPPNRFYHHFLQRGYAVALMSLRGTGQSSGCFEIGGPRENADAAAAVEWLAAQEWSNGAVAMTGVSYDGTTPWEAAVSGAAPSLKAIIPVESISDHYRYSFFEGVPIGGGAAFNTYYAALVDVNYGVGLGAPRVPVPANTAAWAMAQPSNVCPETAEVLLAPYETYRDGVHGAFWDARDMSALLGEATVPVFVVQGFKDFNVKMDHVQTILPLLPEGSRMLLGQWEHNIPWSNTYDEDLSFEAYNVTMDSFLDAYLKGDAAALAEQQAAPRVLAQDSTGRVLAFDSWPPAEANATRWFLDADMSLSTEPAGEGSFDVQASPVAQAANVVGVLPLESGVLLASGAFEATTLLAGNPFLEFDVAVDRAEGRLEARLYKVAGGERELVSLGWQDLALREGRDARVEVPTGTPMRVTLLMEAVAEVFEAGDRLELVIAGENTISTTPHVQATRFTITTGGVEGAALVLPVVAEAVLARVPESAATAQP